MKFDNPKPKPVKTCSFLFNFVMGSRISLNFSNIFSSWPRDCTVLKLMIESPQSKSASFYKAPVLTPTRLCCCIWII